MIKGLEALKEIAIQSVEAIIEKQEPLRTQKINELLETRQFKCIEKELKTLAIISRYFYSEHIIHDLYCLGATDEEIAIAREVLKE